jgi:hypothetical protein
MGRVALRRKVGEASQVFVASPPEWIAIVIYHIPQTGHRTDAAIELPSGFDAIRE